MWSKVLILITVAIQCVFCWMARERSIRGEVDLRSFYTAGAMVRAGHAQQLYDPASETRMQQTLFAGTGRTLPFLYPAFASMFFVPFSVLPYPAAFLSLLTVNLACLYLCAGMLVRRMAVPGLSTGWLSLLFAGFFPVAIALMQGQLSCFLLILFVGACSLAERSRWLLSGLCLSLALVKFQIALPFVALCLLTRNRRLLPGFLSGGVGLVVVSVWLSGSQGTIAYLVRLKGVSSTMLLDHAAAQMQFGMETAAEPNLHGLMTSLAGPGTVSIVLTAVCSLAVVTLAWRRRTVSAAICAALLVSYHMQPYDLVLVILPVCLIVSDIRTTAQPLQSTRRLILLASVAFLSIPLGPFLLASKLTAWFAVPVLGILIATPDRNSLLNLSSDKNRPALG